MNPISTASSGLLSGLARFDSASTDLTKAFNGSSATAPASDIVDQITAGEQVQASAATIRASDRMLKQHLDIKV